MKILYLMHVNWNWIKQRPHFIAEYLQEKGCEVDVYYPKAYNKKKLVSNSAVVKSIHSFPRLPFEKYSLIKKINKKIYSMFIRMVLKKNKYDYVYITHPNCFFDGITAKIIYDCMDDCAEFPMTDQKRKTVWETENQLLRQSSIVLFSAEHLSETVRKRSGITPPIFKTVNNAINLTVSKKVSFPQRNIKMDSKLILTYIGTISEWFDFDLLKKVQDLYKDRQIVFNLYGPCEKTYNFDFVNFKGLVKHEMIFDIMAESDVLIMPFVVNDLIKSVNPVKLYEYIYSGKPVISVKYSETEKFGEYVYLYDNNNPESFVEQLNLIKENNYQGKADIQKARQFVENNTWSHRVDEIMKLM
ncbi:MAG: glycosyltransferase [Bacteroidales bacterium]|nr:glycosyltransferase [Bacteroidales bacterium]